MTTEAGRTASPRRPAHRIDPLLVLAIAVSVPALLLGALWWWSSSVAAGPRQLRDEPVLTSADPSATDVLSLRRLAPAIAAAIGLEQFRSEARAFAETLDEDSCLSISVGGTEVYNGDRGVLVIPASLQKIFVAAAALEILGDDFRYRTVVNGALGEDGTVNGDLDLIGGGDPLLSSDWYPGSGLERYPVVHPTSLDSLADLIAARVTRVSGDVVGDASRYDDEVFAPGWGPGVAGVEGGPNRALTVNDSRVAGQNQRFDDPSLAAATELRRLLIERGVEIDGVARSGPSGGGGVEIAAIESVPLPLVIEELLATSDNNTAELLVKEIGVAAIGRGTTIDGLQAIEALLESWGIDTSATIFTDGSGLSRENRVECATILAVLQRFGADSVIGRSLPVAGQTGTLTNLFVDTDVAGRLRAKTGTLGNPPVDEDPPGTKALAGYLPEPGGVPVEFALVLMDPDITAVERYLPVWERLVQLLDSYPSGPTTAQLGPQP